MSNSSYSSTEKLDVGIPIKESVIMNNSNEALKKRYIQIAFAVGLYWYRRIEFICFYNNKNCMFRFVSITMVFLNKYLLSSKDVKVIKN